jgi:hypothetical protein
VRTGVWVRGSSLASRNRETLGMPGVSSGRRVFPLPDRGVLAPSEAVVARRRQKQGGTAKVRTVRRLSPLSGRRAFLLPVAVQAHTFHIIWKVTR